MSLLNEALRDLDQRQQQETGRNPVPGALQDNGGGTPWLTLALSASLVLVSVLALWFWWQSPGEEQNSRVPEPVQNPAALSQAPSPAPDPAIAPIAEPVPQLRESATAPTADAGDEGSAAAGEETDAQQVEARASEPSQRQPEEASPSVAQSGDSGAEEAPATHETRDAGSRASDSPSGPQEDRAEETQETGASNEVHTAGSATENTPETEQASVRQLSPQQVQARIARDIRERLARGDVSGATDQARRHLAEDRDAPDTRAAMASHWLRQEQPVQALEWLPEGVSGAYPQLRLLRARAELQQGHSRQALEWLTRDLPPVASHSRYHVTLAALQQQLGHHEEAAATWARLIEHDDSQARWWAGLGIALEGQGRQESARRAFAQASALPGLNDTLQRYVQSRLSDGSPTSGNR